MIDEIIFYDITGVSIFLYPYISLLQKKPT